LIAIKFDAIAKFGSFSTFARTDTKVTHHLNAGSLHASPKDEFPIFWGPKMEGLPYSSRQKEKKKNRLLVI